MKIVWIVLLVPLCHNGIPSAEGSQSQDSTSSTPDEKQLSMQISLMNGLAENFKKDFSFTSSHKVHQQMDKIFSKLNIYDAKAQMRLLENLGDLIILQNENIKSLVNFVGKLVSEMNIDKLDGQKSLLKNLQNMVASLSGDESVTSVKRLLEKTTTSYDELVQANLEKTTNLYLSSNSNELPNSETIEELSNMVTVHGSFNTNGNIVSVLLQLVKSENENDGSVRIESEDDNRLKINEALQNAQTLYNEMAKDKLNEIKIRSSNKQQQSTLKDLDSMILRMENLEQPNQISLLETLFNLAQEENSSLNVYNRKFKQMNTLYNKSVKEKLEHIEERYFTSEVEYMKYTPPDDRILEQIESLISKINEPDVNDRILVILHRLNDLTPSDEILRDELIGKLETLNNEVAIVQLEAISKQCTENSENIDDSVFQKLDRMIADTRYFDETTKRSLVEVLYQLAYAGKENVKRSKQLIKKATTFIDQWIADHLNRIRAKYHEKQTTILPDDEIFHQLHSMMSPYNELHTSLEIVSVLESMKNLNDETRLRHEQLLEKAETIYNQTAAAKLHELLQKRNSEPPHLVSLNDEIFGELESLISNVNDIKINERILRMLDSMKINQEDDAAETKHSKLTKKVINAMNTWTSDKVDGIKRNFNENKQSAPLLPNDPIFDDLDIVINDGTESPDSSTIKQIINQIMELSGNNKVVMEKCTELQVKNVAFFNLNAQRDLKHIIRKIKKQSDILPYDDVFDELEVFVEGIPFFLISTIEPIFIALNSLTSMNGESLEKRDKLLQSANTEYTKWIKTHLESHADYYKDKSKREYLDSIKNMIIDINNMEVNSIILQHLREMECYEEEENNIRNMLILKAENAVDRMIRAKLWFLVLHHFDPDKNDPKDEYIDLSELDNLISYMGFLPSETQELIIRALLEEMNERKSNRGDLMLKWYETCTIPDLKVKYSDAITQYLQNSDSPQKVDNPKNAQERRGLHPEHSHHHRENNLSLPMESAPPSDSEVGRYTTRNI